MTKEFTQQQMDRINDAEAMISETISDYDFHGLENDAESAVAESLDEFQFTEAELRQLATGLSERMATDEGWTIKDARMMKRVFAARGVEFTVAITV